MALQLQLSMPQEWKGFPQLPVIQPWCTAVAWLNMLSLKSLILLLVQMKSYLYKINLNMCVNNATDTLLSTKSKASAWMRMVVSLYRITNYYVLYFSLLKCDSCCWHQWWWTKMSHVRRNPLIRGWRHDDRHISWTSRHRITLTDFNSTWIQLSQNCSRGTLDKNTLQSAFPNHKNRKTHVPSNKFWDAPLLTELWISMESRRWNSTAASWEGDMGGTNHPTEGDGKQMAVEAKVFLPLHPQGLMLWSQSYFWALILTVDAGCGQLSA